MCKETSCHTFGKWFTPVMADNSCKGFLLPLNESVRTCQWWDMLSRYLLIGDNLERRIIPFHMGHFIKPIQKSLQRNLNHVYQFLFSKLNNLIYSENNSGANMRERSQEKWCYSCFLYKKYFYFLPSTISLCHA